MSAPWLGLLRDGAWLRHAAAANEAAQMLARALADIAEVEIAFPCQANAVFVRLPELIAAGLYARGWLFYGMEGHLDDDGKRAFKPAEPSHRSTLRLYRLMCSRDTIRADIDAFIADLDSTLGMFSSDRPPRPGS